MRFRQREDTGIPEIDLIPMLTVMMGVLAFFVVISVSLGSEQQIEVDLPPERRESPPPADALSDPFIVEIDATGQRLLNGSPLPPEQLAQQIRAYLARNPERTVYLVPSKDLPYEQVMQFLGEMRAIGGDRISLALEDPANPNSSPSIGSQNPPLGSTDSANQTAPTN